MPGTFCFSVPAAAKGGADEVHTLKQQQSKMTWTITSCNKHLCCLNHPEKRGHAHAPFLRLQLQREELW